MSSPPSTNLHSEDNSFSSPLEADLWSLLQEINISVPAEDRNPSDWMDPNVFEQENSEMLQPSKEKGLVGEIPKSKISERNRRMKHSQARKTVMQHSSEQGSIIKKQNHNAKERIRRMQVNASYLALRSLLPDARRSKKKWSSPRIIDRALEYIPELENEIEKLTLKKNDMLSSIAKKQTPDQNQHPELQVLTVSVNEVRKDEVIVQICMQRESKDVLSNLIQNAEGEGMAIMSASSLDVCDERACYHLHVQMNSGSSDEGEDYTAVLRNKIISWLC